jgi:cell division protein FtsI (penicillin-binding protein 3)
MNDNLVPNVVGMGAKDAVYLLETYGLRVKVQGRGKVKSQSCSAGKPVIKDSECVLVLD